MYSYRADFEYINLKNIIGAQWMYSYSADFE